MFSSCLPPLLTIFSCPYFSIIPCYSDDPWQGATANKTYSATYVENTAHCDGCGHCRDLSRPAGGDPA